MTIDTAPHDLDAERAILGHLLVNRNDVGDVLELVRPSDFYGFANASVVALIETVHRDGRPWDTATIATESARTGIPITAADLVTTMADSVGSGWRRTAEWLVELRARRDLLAAASDLETAARNMTAHPADTVETISARLQSTTTGTDDVPDSLMASSNLADEPDTDTAWVVPGLLGRGHRSMIVGFEGHGKSLLLGQVGWCASQGLQPFTRTHADPVAVLHVDLENPRDRIKVGYRPLKANCRRMSRCFDDARHFTWHRNDGIDLRSRRDRSQLEAILRRIQPDLVCIGPLRKSYRPEKGENDERAALAVQAIYDDLRTRYDFALLIEHHAPHADGSTGGRRPRPMGSSTWLGWSEFGFGMAPLKDRPGCYELERWRYDRVSAHWPDQIHKGHVTGSGWYWDGWWRDGGADAF